MAFAKLCKHMRLKHVRTKPYTPKTNGKAERFIQTALRDMGLRQSLPNLRTEKTLSPDMDPHVYWHRPHGGLKAKPPISRILQNEDNLLRLHT